MEVRDRQLHGRLLAGDRPEWLPLPGRRQWRAAQVPGQRHLHDPALEGPEIGTKITASPVIGSDGTVYVGSTNGLSAVRPADGKSPVELSGRHRRPDPRAGKRRHGLLRREVGAVPGNLRRRPRWDAAVAIWPGPGRFALRRVPHRRRGRGRVRRVRHRRSRVLAGWRLDLDLRYGQRRVLVPGHRGHGEQASRRQRGDLRRLQRLEAPRHLEPAAREPTSNDPPTASAGPDQTATVGQVVAFNGSASDQNPDVLSFAWDFGDGKSAFGATAHHAYITAGTYTATLTVSDGLSAATDALAVTVTPSGATLAFSDTFDRSDSSSPGNGWQEAQGDLVIKSNELRNAPLKDTHIAIQPALGGLTHAAAASFASVDNNTGAPSRRRPALSGSEQLLPAVPADRAGRASSASRGSRTDSRPSWPAPAHLRPALNTLFRISRGRDGQQADAHALRRDRHVDGNHVRQGRADADRHGSSDFALAGGSVGVLLGTGTGSTQQYRVDNFAAQVQ